MFDNVVWIRAYESGPLRVVYSRRERDGQPGLSVEYYGRSERNCWHEAVRVDAYPDDAHVHWFPRSGGSHEKPIGSAPSIADAVELVRGFIRDELPGLIATAGFADAVADDARRADVVRTLTDHLFRDFTEV